MALALALAANQLTAGRPVNGYILCIVMIEGIKMNLLQDESKASRDAYKI